MIANQWYAILESNEVRKGKPIGVTRMGEKMVVWRDTRGVVTIMSKVSPSRVQLSVGALNGDCIQCPFHGFEFDTSGACTLIPANGRNAEPPKAMQGAHLSHPRGARIYLPVVGAPVSPTGTALLREHR